MFSIIIITVVYIVSLKVDYSWGALPA